MNLRNVAKRGCVFVSSAISIVRFAAAFATVLIAGLFALPDQAHATPGQSITLTKTASPTIYSAAGQVITYTYVVKNIGFLDVFNVKIDDDKVAVVTCQGMGNVPMGDTLSCTGSYTITAADVSAGSVTNKATATGTPDYCRAALEVDPSYASGVALADSKTPGRKPVG